MGKPNSLQTFSRNLLTWKAARWLTRSPSTKVRAAPPTQDASLFELQFAPPPCATEAPFQSHHRPLYCRLGLRTLVLPHGLWALFAITIASRKVLRERKGGASATKTTHVLTQWSYCMVTTHLFRLAFASTKRTVDNRTRRPSSGSLWLLSLAKYHTISSFGNMWQTVQRCAIVMARAPPEHLTSVLVQPLELPRTSRRGCSRLP